MPRVFIILTVIFAFSGVRNIIFAKSLNISTIETNEIDRIDALLPESSNTTIFSSDINEILEPTNGSIFENLNETKINILDSKIQEPNIIKDFNIKILEPVNGSNFNDLNKTDVHFSINVLPEPPSLESIFPSINVTKIFILNNEVLEAINGSTLENLIALNETKIPFFNNEIAEPANESIFQIPFPNDTKVTFFHNEIVEPGNSSIFQNLFPNDTKITFFHNEIVEPGNNSILQNLFPNDTKVTFFHNEIVEPGNSSIFQNLFPNDTKVTFFHNEVLTSENGSIPIEYNNIINQLLNNLKMNESNILLNFTFAEYTIPITMTTNTTVVNFENQVPNSTNSPKRYTFTKPGTKLNAYTLSIRNRLYCEPNLCPESKTHIACQNNGTFAKTCGEQPFLLYMNERRRNLILDTHNRLRSQIASGQVTGYEPAAHMPLLRWDNELEHLATLHVKRCIFEHDECRNTPHYRFSGQNIAEITNSRDFHSHSGRMNTSINLWFNENLYANQSLIENPATWSNNDTVIEHFIQVAADRAHRVGCAAVRHADEEGHNSKIFLFTCNYDFGNYFSVYDSVYESGPTASQCSYKISEKYPALCDWEDNETYDYDSLESEEGQ